MKRVLVWHEATGTVLPIEECRIIEAQDDVDVDTQDKWIEDNVERQVPLASVLETDDAQQVMRDWLAKNAPWIDLTTLGYATAG